MSVNGKNEVYCSTGTVVGRVVGFDYTVIERELPRVVEQSGADGIELVMLPYFYDKLGDVKSTMARSGLRTAVVHADKDIGSLLSYGGDDNARESMRLWRVNCEFAASLDTRRIVLHLWGNRESDTNFAYNLSFLPHMLDIADEYGIRVMIENIPCVALDPLTRWRQIDELAGWRCGFIYDVRFGQLHGQNPAIQRSDYMNSGRIEHMHISDFGGGFRDFSAIRPILHPNEGKVDFPALFDSLRRAAYRGSLTLESPVMSERGLDIQKLIRTMSWLTASVSEL